MMSTLPWFFRLTAGLLVPLFLFAVSKPLSREGDFERAASLRQRLSAWWASAFVRSMDRPDAHVTVKSSRQIADSTTNMSANIVHEPSIEEIDLAFPRFRRLEPTGSPGEIKAALEASSITAESRRTLVGTYETEAEARFAVGCLRSLSHLDLHASKVVAPLSATEIEIEAARRYLTDAYWESVRQALDQLHAVVIVTVDAANTVQAWDVLEKDTPVLGTYVFPSESVQYGA